MKSSWIKKLIPKENFDGKGCRGLRIVCFYLLFVLGLKGEHPNKKKTFENSLYMLILDHMKLVEADIGQYKSDSLVPKKRAEIFTS